MLGSFRARSRIDAGQQHQSPSPHPRVVRPLWARSVKDDPIYVVVKIAALAPKSGKISSAPRSRLQQSFGLELDVTGDDCSQGYMTTLSQADPIGATKNFQPAPDSHV
jgi:hypothetical protein